MNTASKITLALAASLGLSTVATAQPRHAPHERVVVVRHGEVRHAPPVRYAPPPRHAAPVRYAPPPRYSAPVRYVHVDDRRFARYQRGQRMPAAYRAPQYVVTDWRSQHLAAPPQGHQWVRDSNSGRDFALVAIATGLIASVVLSR